MVTRTRLNVTSYVAYTVCLVLTRQYANTVGEGASANDAHHAAVSMLSELLGSCSVNW